MGWNRNWRCPGRRGSIGMLARHAPQGSVLDVLRAPRANHTPGRRPLIISHEETHRARGTIEHGQRCEVPLGSDRHFGKCRAASTAAVNRATPSRSTSGRTAANPRARPFGASAGRA